MSVSVKGRQSQASSAGQQFSHRGHKIPKYTRFSFEYPVLAAKIGNSEPLSIANLRLILEQAADDLMFMHTDHQPSFHDAHWPRTLQVALSLTEGIDDVQAQMLDPLTQMGLIGDLKYLRMAYAVSEAARVMNNASRRGNPTHESTNRLPENPRIPLKALLFDPYHVLKLYGEKIPGLGLQGIDRSVLGDAGGHDAVASQKEDAPAMEKLSSKRRLKILKRVAGRMTVRLKLLGLVTASPSDRDSTYGVLGKREAAERRRILENWPQPTEILAREISRDVRTLMKHIEFGKSVEEGTKKDFLLIKRFKKQRKKEKTDPDTLAKDMAVAIVLLNRVESAETEPSRRVQDRELKGKVLEKLGKISNKSGNVRLKALAKRVIVKSGEGRKGFGEPISASASSSLAVPAFAAVPPVPPVPVITHKAHSGRAPVGRHRHTALRRAVSLAAIAALAALHTRSSLEPAASADRPDQPMVRSDPDSAVAPDIAVLAKISRDERGAR